MISYTNVGTDLLIGRNVLSTLRDQPQSYWGQFPHSHRFWTRYRPSEKQIHTQSRAIRCGLTGLSSPFACLQSSPTSGTFVQFRGWSPQCFRQLVPYECKAVTTRLLRPCHTRPRFDDEKFKWTRIESILACYLDTYPQVLRSTCIRDNQILSRCWIPSWSWC